MPRGFESFPQIWREISGLLWEKTDIFPDQIHVGIQRRVKGTEAEAAVSGYVDDLVRGKCIAKTFFYHQGSIEKQVIGGDHLYF